MNGSLSLELKVVGDYVAAWSNPKHIALALVFLVFSFIVGVFTLLFVILRSDIDEVLPRNTTE